MKTTDLRVIVDNRSQYERSEKTIRFVSYTILRSTFIETKHRNKYIGFYRDFTFFLEMTFGYLETRKFITREIEECGPFFPIRELWSPLLVVLFLQSLDFLCLLLSDLNKVEQRELVHFCFGFLQDVRPNTGCVTCLINSHFSQRNVIQSISFTLLTRGMGARDKVKTKTILSQVSVIQCRL